MDKLLDSPFWELLGRKQQKELTHKLIEGLSAQLEQYGFEIVPSGTAAGKATKTIKSGTPVKAGRKAKGGKKRGRKGEPVEYKGSTYSSLAEACAEHNISYSTAAVRRKKGQDVETILDELIAKAARKSGKVVSKKSVEPPQPETPKVMRRPASEAHLARYPMAAKLRSVKEMRQS